jgi:hypothetical protein
MVLPALCIVTLQATTAQQALVKGFLSPANNEIIYSIKKTGIQTKKITSSSAALRLNTFPKNVTC